MLKKPIIIYLFLVIIFIFSILLIPKHSLAYSFSECTNYENISGIRNIRYKYSSENKNNITSEINLNNDKTEEATWSLAGTISNQYFENGKIKNADPSISLYKNTYHTSNKLKDIYIAVKGNEVIGMYKFYNFESNFSKLYIHYQNNKPAYLARLDWGKYYIDYKPDLTLAGTDYLMKVIKDVGIFSFYKIALYQQCKGSLAITPYESIREFKLSGSATILNSKASVKLDWFYGSQVNNTQYKVMRKEQGKTYQEIASVGVQTQLTENTPEKNKNYYTDKNVELGKTYIYQIILASTSQYKSNELTIKVPTNIDDIKKCADLIKKYETVTSNLDKTYVNFMNTNNNNDKEKYRTEIENLEKERIEINNQVNSNCDDSYKNKINDINKDRTQLLTDIDTAIHGKPQTQQDTTTCEKENECSRDPVWGYVCRGLCMVSDAFMSMVKWAFSVLGAALSTESEKGKTVEQVQTQILKIQSNTGSSSTGTSGTGGTNTNTTTPNITPEPGITGVPELTDEYAT